jgi:predicted nucleotidyltransferase
MDKWIENFKEVIPVLQKINPSRIIIFGSRARGDGKEDSDIDVIVVSDYFKGIPFLKRMPMLLRMIDFEKHIDFLCYTKDEFERIKDNSVIVSSALQEGIEITYLFQIQLFDSDFDRTEKGRKEPKDLIKL